MNNDNAKAFRDAMNGLVAEHAAGVRAVEQRWQETAAAAEKSANEQVDKVQKLMDRVRERSESLRKQEDKDRIREINCTGDEEEPEELDPEVEQFAQQINDVRRARHQAESAAFAASAGATADTSGRASTSAGARQDDSATTSSTAASGPARHRWGRFGRVEADLFDEDEETWPEPPAAPRAEDVPARGWQAKAGRFGGGQRQPSSESSPAARPDEPEESDVDEVPAEGLVEQQPESSSDRRWQVRAGRFGKSSQPSPARQQQQQRSARPERNPRPAEDEDDDEDDFSHRSWLR